MAMDMDMTEVVSIKVLSVPGGGTCSNEESRLAWILPIQLRGVVEPVLGTLLRTFMTLTSAKNPTEIQSRSSEDNTFLEEIKVT